MQVKVFNFDTSEFDIEDRTVTTLDHHVIQNGLRVWDYDLERGTINTKANHQVPDVDNTGQVWFHVDRDNGGQKLMSDTRVWVHHPTTGERA